MMRGKGKRIVLAALAAGALVVICLLLWSGSTSGTDPDGEIAGSPLFENSLAGSIAELKVAEGTVPAEEAQKKQPQEIALLENKTSNCQAPVPASPTPQSDSGDGQFRIAQTYEGCTMISVSCPCPTSGLSCLATCDESSFCVSTCGSTYCGTCGGDTCSSPTCLAPTCSGEATCDATCSGATCDEPTCSGYVTCDGGFTCGGPTCSGTCGSATCIGVTCSSTCASTCDVTCTATCAPTCLATCSGDTCTATCASTCAATCASTCASTCTGATCEGTCTGATCDEATCSGNTCDAATCTGATCDEATCTGATCIGPTCGITCSDPSCSTTTAFFFAEGYTGEGFKEYLCLGQPVDAPLDVTVTYMFKGGGTQTETYTVPALSRLTVDVNQAVGAGKDVSMKCEAAYPFIAERPMYFTYGAGWTGGHDAVGASAPSREWYFAEGYTGPGFDEYICVLNPGEDDADLTFRFQTQDGEKVVGGKSVPAGSRETFLANGLLDGAFEASLKLESSVPVVAERPMYFDYLGTGNWHWNGGHCVMGASSLALEYFFAEGCTGPGFEEYLTIQNPHGEDIVVSASYQLGPGQGGPVSASYTIPKEGRKTVYINGPEGVGPGVDVSVHLTCADTFLAERPMYFNYSGMGPHAWTGGHCVIGATASADTWFFAEGYTGAGFEEWICIQNPGTTAADVTITYYPEGGGEPIVCPQPQVGANSRYTAYVNGPTNAGPGRSISAEVTSDQPVICERPMYFDYNAVWTGGHDVVGYTP